MSSDYQKTFSARTSEVLAEGRDVSYAAGMAHLEYLLAIPWPTDWGDDYQVLLYGDFDPPAKDLEFPSLGIRVLADPIEGSVIATAKTVLAARISIKERSVAEIANATRRVNILIGTWTLLTWGNASTSTRQCGCSKWVAESAGPRVTWPIFRVVI